MLNMETDTFGLENFFYNHSSVALDSAEIEFLRLNVFYNLNITEMTDHCLPVVHKSLQNLMRLYHELGIPPMVEFISQIMDKIQPHIEWSRVDMQELEEKYSRPDFRRRRIF